MMFERMRSTEYIKFNSNIYFSSLTKGFIFYFCFCSVAQYIQLTIVNGGKWSSVPLPDPVPFTVPCSGTDVKRSRRWEQILQVCNDNGPGNSVSVGFCIHFLSV